MDPSTPRNRQGKLSKPVLSEVDISGTTESDGSLHVMHLVSSDGGPTILVTSGRTISQTLSDYDRKVTGNRRMGKLLSNLGMVMDSEALCLSHRRRFAESFAPLLRADSVPG
jgi:hypothetical protein